MIEALRSLIETLKLTGYDLLAVLLPGALLVRGFGLLFPGAQIGSPGAGPLVPDALAFTVLAYAAGLVAQGAGGLVSRRRTAPEPLEMAKKLIVERYGRTLPDGLVIDFCLTKLETRRAVYDKFVALRGMARALVVAAGALGVARAALGQGLEERLAVLAATAVVCVSLRALYLHYAPLGDHAVVGMFIATESPPLEKAAPATERA